MYPAMDQKIYIYLHISKWIGLWLLFCLAIVAPQTVHADTLDERYPGLATGLLKSAVLAPLDNETLLIADGVTIKRSRLLAGINNHESKLRNQLEKNLVFVLEQEAVRRILLSAAQKAGISVSGGNEKQAIQSLFEHQTSALSVSEDEVRSFYETNQEMMGGAPLEEVADSIRQYLLQDKKQQAISNYMDGLGDAMHLRINERWVQAQNRLCMDNPVDKARRSDKPTMVEFGATGCVPCDMMQPILDNLRKDYPQKLNVIFVHVREEQVLAARYGIRSIPVQVFFDAKGKEVFRHVGFFSQTEVTKQLEKIGVKK